jgi:nucleoid-associated protein YgaU
LDSSGFIERLYKKPPLAVASRESVSAAVNTKERVAPAGEKTAITSRSVSALSVADGAVEYTVEPGDTLSQIARRYYGNQSKWEKIFHANQRIMRNPDYIYVGQKIIIPS